MKQACRTLSTQTLEVTTMKLPCAWESIAKVVGKSYT